MRSRVSQLKTYEKYDEEDGEQEVNVVFCGSRLGSFSVRFDVLWTSRRRRYRLHQVCKNEEEDEEEREALYGYEKDDEKANQKVQEQHRHEIPSR